MGWAGRDAGARLLIEAELARGDLVVTCNQPLLGEQAYYPVTPERDDERLVVTTFRDWLGTLLDN